jgi:hypothetical protein
MVATPAHKKASAPSLADRYRNVHVEIEVINAATAQRYLKQNHPQQRAKDKTRIDRYKSELRANEFQLTTDCIGFDEDDYLINGQNRLEAIVQTKVSGVCAVMRRLPSSSVQKIDIAKGRNRADRLTINGMPIEKRIVTLVELAAGSYEANAAGTSQLNHYRNDKLIYEIYKHHELFIHFLKDKKLLSNKLVAAATIKLYAFMCGDPRFEVTRLPEKIRDLAPDREVIAHARAIHFCRLAKDGHNRNCATEPDIDHAGILLHKFLGDEQNVKRYTVQERLRFCVTYAHQFAYGLSTKLKEPYLDDGLGDLKLLPPTTVDVY